MRENNENKLLRRTFFWRSISLSIPLILIGLEFGLHYMYLLSLVAFIPLLYYSEVLFLIEEFIYNVLLRPGLYIIALVITVSGKQDIVSVIFYVLAGLQAFNIIKYLFFYIAMLLSVFKKE